MAVLELLRRQELAERDARGLASLTAQPTA
jgi:hypothetical protein